MPSAAAATFAEYVDIILIQIRRINIIIFIFFVSFNVSKMKRSLLSIYTYIFTYNVLFVNYEYYRNKCCCDLLYLLFCIDYFEDWLSKKTIEYMLN